MKTMNSLSWWSKGVATAGLLATGLVIAGSIPALADPPDHARAYGYRRNSDRDRNDHRGNDWKRVRRNDHNRRYRDDYEAHDYRNRDRSWAYRDSDGDGVRNGRDRYPTNYRRH